MRTLRIGVLGCASIAWRRTLPAIVAEPSLSLTAVASRDTHKARRFADQFQCEAVTGYGELLDRDDIDAVYIPLPAGMHAKWADHALRAGRHVLAEKPLTTSLADTEGLVTVARERRLLLMENFMFVHHSQHAAVRQLVADGAIGTPRAFLGAFTIPALPETDIRYQPGLGGGALFDVGGYPVRAAELFLGPDLEVLGSTLRYDPRHGVDVAGAALLRTPEGVTASLTFGMEHAYRSTYEIWGDGGSLTVSRAFTPPADHAPLVRLELPDGVKEITLPADDQFANVVRAFARGALGDCEESFAERQAEEILRHARLMETLRLGDRVTPTSGA